jgi:hypothetical protein
MLMDLLRRRNMSTTRKGLLVSFAIGMTLLAACNFPRADGTGVSGPDLVRTYAAETVQAQLTLAATGVQPALTPGLPEITSTPPVPGDTPTTSPGTTETPTAATGTPAAEVCDQGDFVRDVTYPDNSTVEPGEEFTKTWRLRNSGTCTWNANYSIVFDRGEAMGGPASAPLTTGTVPPGEEVDVSVRLRAPQEEGSYQGFWMLRNQAGQVFGLGSQADREFWVRVRVESADVGDVAQGTFDFIAQASSADWESTGRGEFIDLTFGGAEDDPDGFAKIVEDIRLETGVTAGKTLLMRPRDMHNGGISGTYPLFRVQEGNVFKARVGFMENCGEGQVNFQLWYEENGELTRIREWRKSCDGRLLSVEEDLSGLRGKRVKFILVVLADGSPQDDLAIWSSPRIERN